MNCQEVMELMQRHIDGDLDQQETSLMMDHVGGCPECAAMLDRLQRLSNELAQLPRVVPKFSLVDAIMPDLLKIDEERRLEAEAAAEIGAAPVSKRSERPGRRSFRGWPGVVAMGVAAIALVFTLQMNDIGGGHSNNDAAMLKDSLSAAPQASNEFSEAGSAAASEQRIANDVEVKPEIAMNTQTVDAGEPALVDPVAPSGEPTMRDSGKDDQFGAASVDSEPPATSKSVTPTVNDVEEAPGLTPDDSVMFVNGEDEHFNKSLAFAEEEQPAMLVSPDGKWRAVAVAGTATIQVYDTDGDVLAFESEAREGSIGHLTWDPDSKLLTYVWTDAQGIATPLAYDAEAKQEIKQEMKTEQESVE